MAFKVYAPLADKIKQFSYGAGWVEQPSKNGASFNQHVKHYHYLTPKDGGSAYGKAEEEAQGQ